MSTTICRLDALAVTRVSLGQGNGFAYEVLQQNADQPIRLTPEQLYALSVVLDTERMQLSRADFGMLDGEALTAALREALP